MSLKRDMTLQEARILATKVIKVFQPACHWIEVAGSLRRQSAIIHDIELVVIPKHREIESQSKPGQSRLDHFVKINDHLTLNDIVNQLGKSVTPIKNGPKYKQIYFHDLHVQVDLFIANRDNLGLIMMIRTGSADYSHNFMIELKKKGEYISKDGFLRNRKTLNIIPVKTERKLYDIVGFPYIEPRLRIDDIFPPEDISNKHVYTCVSCGTEFTSTMSFNPKTVKCRRCYRRKMIQEVN